MHRSPSPNEKMIKKPMLPGVAAPSQAPASLNEASLLPVSHVDLAPTSRYEARQKFYSNRNLNVFCWYEAHKEFVLFEN